MFFSDTDSRMPADPNSRIVSFSVGLPSGPRYIETDQIMIFNNPFYNNGNHYDTASGYFNVPADGVYMFTLHARPGNTDSICEVIFNIFFRFRD